MNYSDHSFIASCSYHHMSLPRIVSSKMEDCLKQGAEGRKLSIMLQNLEYSGDLSNQLMAFSCKMEAVFKHLQDLKARKVDDPKAFRKHLAIVDEKLDWYTKAEALNCGDWLCDSLTKNNS